MFAKKQQERKKKVEAGEENDTQTNGTGLEVSVYSAYWWRYGNI